MEFDDRILRFGIEVDGVVKYYEGLDIRVSGQKYSNKNQDECTVEIFNLEKETRNYILTETSPFNDSQTLKRIYVEAGRKSYGASQVYVGDIIKSYVVQPPDIKLTVKALTGNYQKGIIVNRNGGDLISFKALAALVAKDIGATLVFEALDKRVTNYSFTGSAIKQIQKLSEIGDYDVFLDGNSLFVKNRGVPLTNRKRFLSYKTGLIGIPEVTDKGIKAIFLYDNETALGGEIEIESVLNPSLNGDYLIYKLGFELTNRQTPFYWIAEAERL